MTGRARVADSNRPVADGPGSKQRPHARAAPSAPTWRADSWRGADRRSILSGARWPPRFPRSILWFWVAKILTTAGGEATSDYLKTWGNIKGGGTEVRSSSSSASSGSSRRAATRRELLVSGVRHRHLWHGRVGLLAPRRPYPLRRHHLAVGADPGCGLRALGSSEGTLSIHSIVTQRREAFYWATVFATFALGTALGDFTAASLNLGYLASGMLFGVMISSRRSPDRVARAQPHRRILGRVRPHPPLGASFADYISKPQALSGINFGDDQTALVFFARSSCSWRISPSRASTSNPGVEVHE